MAAAASQVTGTATYRERMALPADAVLEVTLADVSRADAAATPLGTARIERPGQPPFRFAIPYDSAKVDPRMSYAVRARVTAGGRLLFTTTQRYPVLTGGAGREVALVLARVGGADSAPAAAGTDTPPPSAPPPNPAPAAAAPPLQGTRWVLVRVGMQRVITPTADPRRVPHLVLDPAGRRVTGSGGCNRLFGGYALDGTALTFAGVGGTRMACPDVMATETAFTEALGRVRAWRVVDGRLEMLDAPAGEVVLAFVVAPSAPEP